MKPAWKEHIITVRAFTRNLGYLASGRWYSSASHVPTAEFHVPADFFGICVASAQDHACDDFIVTRLKELGVLCVRVDITSRRDAFIERFLKRLLDEQFRVCLHLVQTREEVKAMANPACGARTRWRSFVADMLDAYGSQADLIEIGSTCNRRKWSGYTLPSFLLSWQIAWEEAHQRNIGLAGPNVTDFEPVYNIAILGEMKRSGMLPVTQTNNLFVERATEPEAFDHKILGRRMAGTIRFNLIRKAQLLNDIALWAGVSNTVCSQVSWSLRRIARLLDDVEEKQADYVGRYCCLAAASGALKRVYWGPLIGQREGLIDDGTSEFPEIPHVTLYGRANGEVSNFRLRPAFHAFQTVNRFIAGTTFKRKYPSEYGLEILEFVTPARNAAHIAAGGPDQLVHAAWTMNGLRAAVSDCYESNALDNARIYSRNGVQLDRAPDFFSESPVYMVWPAGTQIEPRNTPSIVRGIRFANIPATQFALIDHPPWKGVALAEDAGKPIDITSLVRNADFSSDGHVFETRNSKLETRKSKTKNQKPKKMLRDTRNRVWTMPAPWNINQTIIVKQFPPRHLFRRILQCGKPDKAQRSWNSAQELIRRGINTPMPIAFFHIPEHGLELTRLPVEPPCGQGKGRKLSNSNIEARNPPARGTALPAAARAQRVARRPGKQYRMTKIQNSKQKSSKPRSFGHLNIRILNLFRILYLEFRISHSKTFSNGVGSSSECYFICRAFTHAWSVREAFTAFSMGNAEFQGIAAPDLYDAIACFLRKMHERGVFFRDLSAGNLLFRSVPRAGNNCSRPTLLGRMGNAPNGRGGYTPGDAPAEWRGYIEFALIDTARARFYPGRLGLRQCLCDLMRICHPLHWQGREAFIGKYMALINRPFSPWMKIPFIYYDWKHRIKNSVKKRRN